MRTGVILSGGRSSRMGSDKSFISLGGKPLVLHVAERLAEAVDEVIVVVCADSAEAYRVLGLRVVTDLYRSDTPLVGAYTGLNESRGGYTFLTAGDQPLLDPRVVEMLFDRADMHDAATPSWPNGWVEPLHSVYRTRQAADVTKRLVKMGEKRLRLLIDALPDVRRVPIAEIRAIDPELRTLMDVDTAEELDSLRRVFEKA